MRWWLRAAVLSLLAGAGAEGKGPPSCPRRRGRAGAGGSGRAAGGAGLAGAGPPGRGWRRGQRAWCRCRRRGAGGGRCRRLGRGPRAAGLGGGQGAVPVAGLTPPALLPSGSGQSESQAVVGRVGESTVLGCDLLDAHEARPPLYVIEWVRFGFVLPIFIKFGLYSPRVDPEYIGKSCGRGAVVVGGYGVLGGALLAPASGLGLARGVTRGRPG